MNKLNHIAFIMDGNGRWGKRKKKTRNFGHFKGVETVKKVVKNCIKLKVPVLTFYVFSSENWKRPKKEVSFLFKLIQNYFAKEIKNIQNQGIKIKILGELNKLPVNIKSTIKKTVFLTKNNKRIVVNLAINYGSKNEIIRAIRKTKKFNIKNFEKNLFTKNMPDPDILIRTGGHQRLSNFMLWQLAYAELYFLKKLWPDFNNSDLRKVIENYKRSKRNFGGI
mgnify:CR=1|tara:strand:- start:28 stop:693 length:666 start_codon:yes stop_codon:yes gene_type:complete